MGTKRLERFYFSRLRDCQISFGESVKSYVQKFGVSPKVLFLSVLNESFLKSMTLSPESSNDKSKFVFTKGADKNKIWIGDLELDVYFFSYLSRYEFELSNGFEDELSEYPEAIYSYKKNILEGIRLGVADFLKTFQFYPNTFQISDSAFGQFWEQIREYTFFPFLRQTEAETLFSKTNLFYFAIDGNLFRAKGIQDSYFENREEFILSNLVQEEKSGIRHILAQKIFNIKEYSKKLNLFRETLKKEPSKILRENLEWKSKFFEVRKTTWNGPLRIHSENEDVYLFNFQSDVVLENMNISELFGLSAYVQDHPSESNTLFYVRLAKSRKQNWFFTEIQSDYWHWLDATVFDLREFIIFFPTLVSKIANTLAGLTQFRNSVKLWEELAIQYMKEEAKRNKVKILYCYSADGILQKLKLIGLYNLPHLNNRLDAIYVKMTTKFGFKPLSKTNKFRYLKI